MNAYMGMRITEWEDGQVNIGIAVCPSPTKLNAPVIGCYWTRGDDEEKDDTRMSDRNNNEEYILPKSAFIIRPATTKHNQTRRRSHQHNSQKNHKSGLTGNGFSITYGHLPNSGISNLGILLTTDTESKAEDQEQEGRESGRSLRKVQEQSKSEEEERMSGTGVGEFQPEEQSEALLTEELEEVKKTLEREDDDGEVSPVSEESENSLEMNPQDITASIKDDDGGGAKVDDGKEEGSEGSLSSSESAKRKKRVSWVDEENVAEIFTEERQKGKESRRSSKSNNSKENKNEERASVRKSKSNGYKNRNVSSSENVNGANRGNSTTKKRQDLEKYEAKSGGAVVDNINYSGGSVGKRMSGDKSRIPVITIGSGGGGDYLHPNSCEFYRRQMLRECYLQENNYSPPTLAENWYGYTSLQRYAGQKVMKKLAAEQKRLEEDVSNRRKTEIWILGNDMDEYVISSPAAVPIRKKPTKLKPIQMNKSAL